MTENGQSDSENAAVNSELPVSCTFLAKALEPITKDLQDIKKHVKLVNEVKL